MIKSTSQCFDHPAGITEFYLIFNNSGANLLAVYIDECSVKL